MLDKFFYKMEKFNKRKQVIKGQLTKISNYVDSQGSKASYDELQTRLEKIQDLYSEFVQVEDNIFAIDATVLSEMEVIDDVYFTIVPKIQGLCREKSLSPLNAVPVTNTTANESLNTSQNTSVPFKADFKLPRLNLPIFDGSLKDWHSFYDIFVSTVHENTAISPAQKFKYLLGQLKGPPYKLVCHFRIDDANYYEAFQRLSKRYDKQKQIINEYIKNFLHQAKVYKPNAAAVLRIHDSVDETIRGLKSINPRAEHRDPWIIYLAFDKLDEETKQLWKYESSEDDFPSVDKFLTFLLKRIDALSDGDGDQTKSKPRSVIQPNTSRTFHATTLPDCPFCNGEQHNLYQCPNFLSKSVDDRRKFMANSRRCYNCLSEFHVVAVCKNKRKCQKCNKRHNTLLHLDIDPNKPAQPSVDDVKPTSSSNDKTTSKNYFVNNDNSAHNSIIDSTQLTSRNIHILPTAKIQVMNSKGNWLIVRALLDSGSTHSFITESCAKRLQVPRLETEISVGTLNNCEAGVSRGVTNFKIRSIWEQEYSLRISALIIPTISTKLPSTNIETSYRQISSLSLPLADQEYYKPAPIDILLGCEHFFASLIEGKIHLIPNVLIAQNTRFGWIIGGTYNEESISSNIDLNSTVLHVQPNIEICNLEQTLKKFWETEELPSQQHLSEEERNCVESVKANTSFVNNRIVLQLPFKQIPPLLGESYSHALRRFHALETIVS